MTSMMTAIVISLVCFLLIVAVMMRLGRSDKARTKEMLEQLSNDAAFAMAEMQDDQQSILRTDFSGMPLFQFIAKFPYGEKLGSVLLKAGLEEKAAPIIFFMLAMMVLAPIIVYDMTGRFWFALGAFLAVPYMTHNYASKKIKARNIKFINDFPDVLDMIVRSVRSGFPLNTALNMVAENMEAPISTEFRQVVDEIALGRSLDDALIRLSQRIDEQDVKFFIVVLRVQQETGGNLAEVITNLSNVIRKRKQLRLKIRAMTSEGRATGWILGAIPVVLFSALYLITPTHLEPLLNTDTGNMWLGIAVGLVVLAQVIVRKMLNVEI